MYQDTHGTIWVAMSPRSGVELVEAVGSSSPAPRVPLAGATSRTWMTPHLKVSEPATIGCLLVWAALQVGCVVTNNAAVAALQLRDEQVGGVATGGGASGSVVVVERTGG